MAGTKLGAQKAAQHNLSSDPDFYRKIGQKSWTNPQRSRTTGFAAMPKDKHRELSRKGGKKTKDDYNLDEGQKEALAILQEEIRRATEASE
jgi:general stress protein YciG